MICFITTKLKHNHMIEKKKYLKSWVWLCYTLRLVSESYDSRISGLKKFKKRKIYLCVLEFQMLGSMLLKSKTTNDIYNLFRKSDRTGASTLLIRQTGKCLKYLITNQLPFSSKHEHCGIFEILCGNGNVWTQLCFLSTRIFPEKNFGIKTRQGSKW